MPGCAEEDYKGCGVGKDKDMEEINIYCDESCHLLNDGYNVAVLGALSIGKGKVREINERIREIKKKHGVYEHAEIKWVKVSINKIDMYKDLIDLFFEYKDIWFRAVVANNKSKINLDAFGFTYDDWYYRICYLLLREMTFISFKYNIYLDNKDTKGSQRIKKLSTVLDNSLFTFYETTINNVQLVRSDQIDIMGILDLLIGAVSYKNRGLTGNKGKTEIIEYIESKINRPLNVCSKREEKNVNIFLWEPRDV